MSQDEPTSEFLSTLPLDCPKIQAFMSAASIALGQTLPNPKAVFAFGDSSAVVEKLNESVLAGTKTAATSWPVPSPCDWEVGGYSVALRGDGEPVILIRTTELEEKPFMDVDGQLAFDEGEDDGSLKMFRQEHDRYYNRHKEREVWSMESARVLCERFEMV